MSNNEVNNQQVVSSASAVTGKARARGKYWEITYRQLDTEFKSWPLRKSDLTTETGKTNVEVTAEPGTRAVNLSKKEFQTCDFNHFTLKDSTFADCTFDDCRFVKSDFDNVKFSRCHFKTCHFLIVRFQRCQFIDCTFSNISASAEHLLFVESSISAAAFVDALVTNLMALPPDVTKDYQEYRHLSTKAKIARAIFISVRDEPELDQLFDANRCFEIALQRRRIAEARWTETEIGGQLVKRSGLYRFMAVPRRVAALGMMRMAGFFTDWGRSPLKSVWFLVTAFMVFAGVYYFAFKDDISAATLRALDCTFVFGYTRYAAVRQPGAIDWIMFLNAFAGFYWYALLVPALSKRLFR